MKVTKKVLVDFINKITPVPVSMTEMLLDFQADGIHISAGEMRTRSLLVSGFLPKEHFEEYEALGVIGLRNLNTIKDMINSLDGDMIVMEHSVKTLNFHDTNNKKTVECILPNPDYIQKIDVKVELDFDDNVEISKKDITTLLKNFSAVNAEEFVLEFDKTNLKATTKSANGDFSIEENITLTKECKPAKIILGNFFSNIINSVGDSFVLNYKTGRPIKVSFSDAMIIDYILVNKE